MKRMKKILFAVITVCSMILLAGCSSAKKEPVTSEEFTAIMKEAGYQVTPAVSVGPDTNAVFTPALKDNGQQSIRLYEFETAEAAAAQYEVIVAQTEGHGDNTTVTSEGDGKGYAKTVVENERYYQVTVKVENTLLRVGGFMENKKEMQELVKKLGY